MNRASTVVITLILLVVVAIGGIYAVSHSRNGPAVIIQIPASATLRASIGQEVTGLSVTLTPLEVTGDSRCPANVNCVWAGTVTVRTRVQNAAGTNATVFELGKSVALGELNIVLTEVTPQKTTSAIATSSYQFTYQVTRK